MILINALLTLSSVYATLIYTMYTQQDLKLLSISRQDQVLHQKLPNLAGSTRTVKLIGCLRYLLYLSKE